MSRFASRKAITARNALIENISGQSGRGFVTISYREPHRGGREATQVVVLIVDRDTKMRDQFGNRVGLRGLKKGMVINARFSATMTRSYPPQSRAFAIEIVKENKSSLIEEGRVLRVDALSGVGYILTGVPNNPNRQMRYVVSDSTTLMDRRGNPIRLRSIRPGQTVRIERRSFQTASIPPQTSAIWVQVIS